MGKREIEGQKKRDAGAISKGKLPHGVLFTRPMQQSLN